MRVPLCSVQGFAFPTANRICKLRFTVDWGTIPEPAREGTPIASPCCRRENDTWRQRRMVHTTVDGTFRQTNLTNESPDYLAKREELRLAEIELMRQRERVAELRRHLPQGAAIQDYQFQEGPRDLNVGDAPGRTVRLTELFTKPNRSLVVYHFMYGKAQ